MKIALSQINSTTGDLSGNTKKIIKEIEVARQKNAQIIVFPEMAITGYCISDLVEEEDFLECNKLALEKIAEETKDIIAVVGFIDYDLKEQGNDGRIARYNAAAVLQNGKILDILHKSLLPNYGIFDDKRFFTPGKKRKIVPVKIEGKKLNLGITICEDMWDENYKVKPVQELAKLGADLLININASPFVPGKFSKRYEVAKKHAINSNKPFVYVNTVGVADIGKNIISFDGQSFFCDKKGNLAFLAKKFEEETLIIDQGLESIISKSVEIPEADNDSEVYGALVSSLKDYALKNGFKRAVVPVSGGIDSALGLVLCVEAFGKENVLAYNLPSKYNTSTTKSIAKKLSKNLGVEYKVIPIQKVLEVIESEYETNSRKIEKNVSKENIQARIRGLLMMVESNDTGALLISNGNKTEIALGYSTLYGDMCGGLSLIGDVSKPQVYSLSRYANKKFGSEIIPKEVFTIKPSAELSEGQYDPFDYSVVSPIVDEFIETRASPRKLIEMFINRTLNKDRFLPDSNGKSVYEKHNEDTFKKLVFNTYNSFKKSAYKRVQAAPILIVTSRAFGFDFREPSINYWRGS